MNYLKLENVTKSFGPNILFDKINLDISKGQKVALVAKNGAGKSTLLKIVVGEEAAEGETALIEFRKGIRFNYLGQNPDFIPEHSVLDTILDSTNPMVKAVKDYELALLHPDNEDFLQKATSAMDDLKAWDMEAKIKEVLYKLNITDLNKQINQLSGGQVKRVALAKLVIDEPEFIILDEPTNHLDLDMIEWLEEYLQLPNITLLMVTHDRYFLDRVCNQIVEIDNKQIYKYSGNYSDFLIKKAARHENEAVVLDKTRKLFKKELDWMNRMPKARTTKSKSRIDAFKEIKAELAQTRHTREMHIEIKGQRLGKTILEAHHISKAYSDKKIVEGFSYKFKKGEKVGIVGPNGAGKTTLINLLTKSIKTDAGKVVIGGNTHFGYYTQHGFAVDEERRIIDVVRDVAEFIPLEKGRKLTAELLLERFLFDRKKQQDFVAKLSGGERRRLYLLTVLMTNPNFLILDEPTNDLDIVTLNVLEDFLIDFPGCVIIVSHDRYFLDKVVDHLFVFEDEGHIRDFNGDYTAYRLLQKEQLQEKRALAAKQPKETKSTPVQSGPGLSYEDRKLLGKIERKIANLEKKKEEIEASFMTAGLDADQIKELSQQLSSIKEELEEKELEWMELAEKE